MEFRKYFKKYNLKEIDINVKILRKIREEIFSLKIEDKLEILDLLSIMLGGLGFVSVPFNLIISGISLLIAIGTKTITEDLLINNVKNILKNETMNNVKLKNLSIYFSLLDGVTIPILKSNEKTLFSNNENLITVYKPKHWRSSE